MIFTRTKLPDSAIIDVERRGDERGYLARVFCEREFADAGLPIRWVQGSSIYSPQRHTLRGLAWPEAPRRIISERDLAWPDYAPAAAGA